MVCEDDETTKQTQSGLAMWINIFFWTINIPYVPEKNQFCDASNTSTG